MTSKETILSALRSHTRETYPMPDLASLQGITFADPVAQFIEKATTAAGARLTEVKAGDDVNELIRQAYPEARLLASNVPGIQAEMNPDTVDDARDLMRVDVGIIQGYIGVAENACIWVPQTMKERSICFASENLVILLSRSNIVSNMHEAYARIEASGEYFQQYKFGTFISGPSKTADIESALVYGAQAARSVTILLTE